MKFLQHENLNESKSSILACEFMDAFFGPNVHFSSIVFIWINNVVILWCTNKFQVMTKIPRVEYKRFYLSGINSHFLNFIPTVNSEIFSYLERGKTPILSVSAVLAFSQN